MAEYINIKGINVEVVASDPANPTVGQIWYNSTSNTLKAFNVTTTATFSSGPTMATARRVAGTTGDSVDQAMAVGGYIGPAISNATEEYSGTAWSTGTNIPLATYGGSCCGTQTATLFGLGNFNTNPGPGDLNTSYEYDGATWTAGGTLSKARNNTNGGFGTQTAAVFSGGDSLPAGGETATEEYNGTSWTNGNVMNIARVYPAGIGTQTAGLVAAGPAAPAQSTSEEYDGTSWTAGGNLPGPRGEQPNLFGIQTSAVLSGGNDGSYMNTSITYDGTSWSANPATLITARGYGGGAGVSTSGIIFSGYNGSNLTSSEIYTGAGVPNTVTITGS